MRRRSDWLGALACVAVGVLVAAFPHLVALARTGDPAWVADGDERFYLEVGSQAYFNHPARLTDPVRAGEGPSLYKPLPLLPGVLAARGLGLGPLGIGPMWRILGGAAIGLAWYALFRQFVPRPWVAAALGIVMLSDSGLIEGMPLFRHAIRTARAAVGRLPADAYARLHSEWRVTTPTVTLAFLIAMLWAVARARGSPTWGRIATAGLAFGLLFHVYFYYWTAAGLALVVAWALDAGHRRVYLHTAWLGGLIGLPSVVADALMKRRMPPDWLPRADKFLPIGRFDELLLPWGVALLLAAGLAWALVRRRDLIFAWAMAAAGYVLLNHQVVTRLQIENYHWWNVLGPALAALIVLAAAGEVGARSDWSPRARGAVWALAAVMLGSGLWLRGLEATRSPRAIEDARALDRYRAVRPPGRSPGLAPNAVIAGPELLVDFAAILDNLRPLSNYAVTLSPTVTNDEWDDRIAVNAALLGLDRDRFEADQAAALEGPWGPWGGGRDASLRAERLALRLAAFDRARADVAASAARYAVRYLALPAGRSHEQLGPEWSRIQAGPDWDLWERDDGRAARPLPHAGPGSSRRDSSST